MSPPQSKGSIRKLMLHENKISEIGDPETNDPKC